MLDVNVPQRNAVELLLMYGQNLPPIDVLTIAQNSSIEVYATEFTEEDGDDVSGSIEIENDKPVIYVNKDHPVTRQRFTIAHELGHWFCGHLLDGNGKIIDNAECKRSAFWDLKEREANQFAAELLMPSRLLKIAIASGIKTYRELAILFNVSYEAMSYRLQNVNGIF